MNNVEQDEEPALQEPTLPGDLGRRVHYWRERSNMTRAELAERAGMSAEYLEYFETRPTGQLSTNALARIAAVLGTTIAELLGGNVERAPGGGLPAVRQPHLVTLALERSRALLGKSGIGRIVFDAGEGPIALPVNYAVLDHDILLRTDEDTVIAKIKNGANVSFEADHIDSAMSKGWSVVVQASCEHLADSTIDEIFEKRVDPWAGRRRKHWIRLRTQAISGRAIETDQ